MSSPERCWLILERAHGRIDSYRFTDEKAARAGAAAYLSTDTNEVVAARVATGPHEEDQ